MGGGCRLPTGSLGGGGGCQNITGVHGYDVGYIGWSDIFYLRFEYCLIYYIVRHYFSLMLHKNQRLLVADSL